MKSPFIAAMALLSMTLAAAPAPAPRLNSIDQTAANVRTLNRGLGHLKQTETWLDINESCAGGAKLIAYSDRGRIRRITFQMHYSNWTQIADYYFQNSHLVYVAQRIATPRWNEKRGVLEFTHISSSTFREYFMRHGKLVKYRQRGANASIPPYTAANLLHDANLYKRAIHSGKASVNMADLEKAPAKPHRTSSRPAGKAVQ